MFGILPINKPAGMTSHDVVNSVRRKLGVKRVGHAGTLDPLATGVLVVAVGPATRFLQYLPLEPKVYVGDIKFGSTTDTYDREGEEQQVGEVPENLMEELERIRPQFMGLVQQIPPMHSAVKVQGKALYKYAREGKVVEREVRTVHISEFNFLSNEGGVVKTEITCSGGTYIRTLANDLGQVLGCGAHLSSLLRTQVGKFELANCVELADATEQDLIPLAEALPPMQLIRLDSEQTRHLREGRSVKIDCTPSNCLVGLIEPSGNVFSVARLLGNILQPECVVPENAIFDVV